MLLTGSVAGSPPQSTMPTIEPPPISITKPWVIFWQNKAGGAIHTGKMGFESKEICAAICRTLNAEYPELIHWPEDIR